MRRRQIFWLILFLVALAWLTVLTVKHQEETMIRNLPLIRTSYSARPQGTKALYRTLGEIGFKVDRWKRAWRQLDYRKRNRVLFVIEPLSSVFPKLDDWKRLIEFAEAGNLVWLSSEMSDTVAGESKAILTAYHARPLLPAPWLKGVKRYIVKSGTRLTKPWQPPVQATFTSLRPTKEVPLLSDRNGIVLKVIALGRGYIIIDSNPYALSNEGIGKGDHFRLVLNIVSSIAGQNGEIFFDEWGRGFGEGEHWWWAVTPETRNAILQLVVAGCLLILAISFRFGRPIAIVSRPFSRTAFVYGLATLLRRGNTLQDAVKILELHFLRQVFSMPFLWQLPESEKVEQMLLSLPAAKRGQVRRVWLWAEKLSRQRQLSEKEVLKWAKAMQEVIRKR
ncbi:MAG: DUF4350 domain-containing protein [Armatimonadetes bacterium]|nr:DUF4350 domain-containing protein [Armatimonadota bacterium]